MNEMGIKGETGILNFFNVNKDSLPLATSRHMSIPKMIPCIPGVSSNFPFKKWSLTLHVICFQEAEGSAERGNSEELFIKPKGT